MVCVSTRWAIDLSKTIVAWDTSRVITRPSIDGRASGLIKGGIIQLVSYKCKFEWVQIFLEYKA